MMITNTMQKATSIQLTGFQYCYGVCSLMTSDSHMCWLTQIGLDLKKAEAASHVSGTEIQRCYSNSLG